MDRSTRDKRRATRILDIAGQICSLCCLTDRLDVERAISLCAAVGQGVCEGVAGVVGSCFRAVHAFGAISADRRRGSFREFGCVSEAGDQRTPPLSRQPPSTQLNRTGDAVGKRHRRIRAASATGQVAGAATEKPGLKQRPSSKNRPAQHAFSQKAPVPVTRP
jgi:hypothetical protein